jgi:transcriptional regulator with XRE-family HTH domain
MTAERSPTFADRLRDLRRASGLSQEKLAERAGMSVRALRKLESGATQTPRRDTIDLLASALRLDETAHAAFAQVAWRRLVAGPNAAAQAQRRPRGEEPPLIGRAAELTLVAQQLAGAMPPLLALLGEPGIGKSRLLAEAGDMARSAGWTVLSGGCARRSGQEPYAPFVDMLSLAIAVRSPAQRRQDLRGCSWLPRLLPELAEQRAIPAPDWTLSAEQERRLIFAAIVQYLANIAGPSGTLLLLDDLQWAGQDALDLLAGLARPRVGSTSLRLLIACRDTEIGPDTLLTLLLADLAREGLAASQLLAPLSPEEAGELAELLLDGRQQGVVEADAAAGRAGAGSDESRTHSLATALATRTGGRPYFLVSCALAVRAARERGSASEGTEMALLPWNVAASLRQRIALLPETAQELLGVAAVAGRRAPRMLLMQVGAQLDKSEPELVAALEATHRAGLLQEASSDAYAFAHDLVREVVARDLSAARRASLHRRVGEALEGLPEHKRVPAELAWHFQQAGESARALPYALMAGHQADVVYAHAEAEKHYHVALNLAQDLQEHSSEAEALERLGAILTIQGRQHEALATLEDAATSFLATGDGEGHLRISAQLAELHGVMWRSDDGLKRFAPLAAAADDSGAYTASPGLARLYFALSGMYTQRAVNAGRLHAMIRAEQLARAAQDDVILARVLTQRGRQGFYAGDDVDAPDLRDVLALAERLGDPQVYFEVLGSLAGIHCSGGDLASAQVCYQRGLALAEQVQDFAEQAEWLVGLGTVDLCRGEWQQARVLFEQAETIHEQLARSSAPETFVTIPLSLATLDTQQGRGEPAVARLTQTLALIQLRGIRPSEGPAISALSEYDLVEGRVDPACQRLREFCARPTVHGWKDGWEHLWLHGLPWLAWAQMALGECEDSVRTIQIAVARARALTYPLILVDALRIQAMIAAQQQQYHAATDDLDEAITRCQALPYPYAEAKALWVYGQLEVMRGDPGAATDRFAAALSICDRLGEGLYRPHIEREMRHLTRE